MGSFIFHITEALAELRERTSASPSTCRPSTVKRPRSNQPFHSFIPRLSTSISAKTSGPGPARFIDRVPAKERASNNLKVVRKPKHGLGGLRNTQPKQN